MKQLLPFLLALTSVMLLNCRDEADEIAPQQSVEPIAKKDSTAAAYSSSDSSAVQDSTAIVTSDSVPTATSTTTSVKPKSNLSFTTSEYQRSKYDNMPYRVMTPAHFDEKKNYPLVIFLHGIDERGTDNEKQLRWGASLFQADSARTRHPAFVIFPQCPTGYLWAEQHPMEKLKALIDDFVAKNNVDRKRIYIVGLSMGAFGTYEMVARNPGMFAAAIAISGDGDLKRIGNMSKTQWKIFAGKKDNVVTSDRSERMANALKNSGAKVSLKVYPEANHVGSWVKAFEEPDFLSWLFSVSK